MTLDQAKHYLVQQEKAEAAENQLSLSQLRVMQDRLELVESSVSLASVGPKGKAKL